MRKTLEKFQEDGAAHLASNFHALLADQPGLGKTLQAIAAAERLGLKKVLVVCPASVRSNWLKELNECLGSSYGWQIVSYNEAVKLAGCRVILSTTFQLPTWDLIVLDEAHFLKTPESQRTQAIFGNGMGLARRARYKWALTGTPVLNRPRELFPLLKTLCPAFSTMSFGRFADIYCGAFFDGRALNTKGATNLDDLARKMAGFMLRRTKKEVFPNRTAPLISRVPLELSHADMAAVIAEEDAIGARAVKISSRYEDFSQLGDTSKLLRLIGEAKVPKIAAFVDDLLETVDKVVVFAHHRDVINALVGRLKAHDPVVYQGGMNDAQKDAVKAKFMADPKCRVFIGNRVAAGTGINGLQKVSSTCVIAEPSWVPGETEQMIDRLDRMGQEDDIVNAYLLYAKATLDAVVVQVHDRKEHVVDRVTGDSILEQL